MALIGDVLKAEIKSVLSMFIMVENSVHEKHEMHEKTKEGRVCPYT